MKALSIKQPYAYLIATGVKDIENRTWKTNFRGRIYIHATKRIPLKNFEKMVINLGIPCYQKETYIEGAIIGEVDIIDCVTNHPSIWAEKSYINVNYNSLPFGEENEKDMIIWNWVLANPVLYPEPILGVKGKLSLWEYENIL